MDIKKQSRRRDPRRQRGIALAWTALFIILIIAFTGLSTDMGYLFFSAHQLQNAADGASLAAAQEVRDDQDAARQMAIDIAAANQAAGAAVSLDFNASNGVDGDIVIGKYTRSDKTFVATTSSPNAVKVVARRVNSSPAGPVGLFFGPMFGVGSVEVYRTAIAMIGGGTGAGIIALNPEDPQSFYIHGDATLTVNDGALQVNSDHPSQAARIQGDVTIIAPELNVRGEPRFVGNAYDFEGDVNTGVPYMPDPLAFLEAPPVGAVMSPTGITEPGTYAAGYYPDGIYLTGGHVDLLPGIYILDGEGLYIGGNASMTANDVMFYIQGTGAVTIIGTGDVEVTAAPLDSGPYGGISFFQARDNTNTAVFTGTGFMNDPIIDPEDAAGTLYFPSATVEVGGTGDTYINQLIADKIEIYGTGVKSILYDGRFPAPGAKVFLVK